MPSLTSLGKIKEKFSEVKFKNKLENDTLLFGCWSTSLN